MIGDAPLSRATGIPGWETIAEEDQLIALAANVPDSGIIVELGGEYGRSASQFLLATKVKKNVHVFTVDLYPTDHHIAGDLYKAQRSNLIEAQADLARHTGVKGISWEVGKKWDRGAIDLLFIDAAHDYNAVKSDIAAWVRHVKPGGIVAFHDYAVDANSHPLHFEVKRAVDEWATSFSSWKRVGQVDSLIWFTLLFSTNDPDPIGDANFKALVESEKKIIYTTDSGKTWQEHNPVEPKPVSQKGRPRKNVSKS